MQSTHSDLLQIQLQIIAVEKRISQLREFSSRQDFNGFQMTYISKEVAGLVTSLLQLNSELLSMISISRLEHDTDRKNQNF